MGGEGDSGQCPENQSEDCSAGVYMTIGAESGAANREGGKSAGGGCALES